MPIGEMLRRTLKLLNTVTADEMMNNIKNLAEFAERDRLDNKCKTCYTIGEGDIKYSRDHGFGLASVGYSQVLKAAGPAE